MMCHGGALGSPRLRGALTAALVAASHGVLDSFTRGSAGVMLLWPFAADRYAVWPRGTSRQPAPDRP